MRATSFILFIYMRWAFKLYCIGVYGAQVCDLCDGVIEIFNIAHRTALRRIWGLPYRTRRKILPHIVRFYVCPDHEETSLNKCIIIANTQKTPYRGQKSSGAKIPAGKRPRGQMSGGKCPGGKRPVTPKTYIYRALSNFL